MADTLKEWSCEVFEILNVTPVENMLAVYAQPHPTEHGKHHLVPEPIYFIGVAKVETKFYEMQPGCNSQCVDRCDSGTRVVGLVLAEGYFDVCNEAGNFAGLMREGDNILDANGFLDESKYPLGSVINGG